MSIVINNLKTAGKLTAAEFKAKYSNGAIVLDTEGEIVIKNSEFMQNSYNCVEIGMYKQPSKITIDGCVFGSHSNNVVCIYGTKENTVIDIKDCKFLQCSNPVRLSNKTNVGGIVVNIVNCEFEQWETKPDFAGMILCEDFTSKTPEDVVTNNLFGAGKITINIKNCTHKGQPIVSVDPSECFGTHDTDTQIGYIYYDKGEVTNPTYDAEIFPVLNIE